MRNRKETIRRIINFLNNEEEDGGFWLPNIQRPFVWDEEQICRLFDSVLREYPISTLLIWKTKSTIKRREFIRNWKSTLKLSDFYVPENNKKKCLVLDGQQRLQSFYISLRGSHEGKELFFDVLSGDLAAPDDIKYRFLFIELEKAKFPWVKFKDLIFTEKRDYQLASDIKGTTDRALNDTENEKITRHLELISKTFKSDEVITYQELDSIENPELYGEDDIVEIFIRANSGGTRLGKSDLLFSLLSSSWEDADEEMDFLLDELNRSGFSFTRDFILKTCLTLLNQGARYEVEKFRKPQIRNEIESKWENISSSIKDVLDFVRGKTFIKCDKAIPSYLALIPVIYFRYHFQEEWQHARGLDVFLLRSLLTGSFSGVPDQVIDDCVTKIKQLKGFDVKELFGVLRAKNRSLELTEERFWNMGYGTDYIHILFNLWYADFNYTPAYSGNMPQIDHVFPQSLLKKIKIVNQDSGKRNIMKYKDGERNQLANCMLLTQSENGAGGKSDISPEQWFNSKNDMYLDMHLIPRSKELWKIDKFEDFIKARKELIRQKLSYLLVSQVI
jgi:uncharacterized protein with ParB-like and HNH nuclease domain